MSVSIAVTAERPDADVDSGVKQLHLLVQKVLKFVGVFDICVTRKSGGVGIKSSRKTHSWIESRCKPGSY